MQSLYCDKYGGAGSSRRGVGGVGGTGPAKDLLNEKFGCSLGPGAIKYPGPALALDGPVEEATYGFIALLEP